jgi:methylated-DNA-[protein]-cysteine S-methyltransferase
MEVKSKSVGTLKKLPLNVVRDSYDSPVGTLSLLGGQAGLHALLFPRDLENLECVKLLKSFKAQEELPLFSAVKKQLDEYFAGKRKSFDLPLSPFGTPFQKAAWKALGAIPYGSVITYKEQARALGDLNKVRAVGGANGRNPLSIIVPCHRVVAQGGDLRGFGGGLKMKSYLLALEKSFC